MTFSDKYFNRHLTLALFTRSLPNGQKCNRKWLLYSPSEGSVYFFVCKLYGRENPFISGDLTNGKNLNGLANMKIIKQHGNATNKWLLRSNTNNSVSKDVIKLLPKRIISSKY